MHWAGFLVRVIDAHATWLRLGDNEFGLAMCPVNGFEWRNIANNRGDFLHFFGVCRCVLAGCVCILVAGGNGVKWGFWVGVWRLICP